MLIPLKQHVSGAYAASYVLVQERLYVKQPMILNKGKISYYEHGGTFGIPIFNNLTEFSYV